MAPPLKPQTPIAPESGASTVAPGEPAADTGGVGDGGGFNIEEAFSQLRADVLDRVDHLNKRYDIVVDDIRKVRGKLPKKDAKAEANGEETPAVDGSSGGGALSFAEQAKLTRALSKLPEAKQDEAWKRIESGADLAVELIRAETLLEGMGLVESADPSKGEPKLPSIPGKAASAPASLGSGAFPSYKAWRDFVKADRNRAAAFQRQNPDFDPLKLPGSPRSTWKVGESTSAG